jgi:hypothetical protein
MHASRSDYLGKGNITDVDRLHQHIQMGRRSGPRVQARRLLGRHMPFASVCASISCAAGKPLAILTL